MYCRWWTLAFSLLAGVAQASCPATPTDCPTPVTNPVYINAVDWGVKADGITSNDAAMQRAATACTARGGTMLLPAGQILLTGANSINWQNCKMLGAGIAPDVYQGTGEWGTTFILTSTSVKPFVVRGSFAVDGVNFYWPNQTGADVYPPLFSDDGTHGIYGLYVHNTVIVNAYDGFAATLGVDWSNMDMSDSSMYAVNDLFRFSHSGDSSRIANVHFTHGFWAGLKGYPAVAAYLNTADQNNTILHITGGGVEFNFINTTSFAWRYGIKVESGAAFGNSQVNGSWDGILTYLDTSAGGCTPNLILSGAAWVSYTPQFNGSGGVSQLGNAPAINLGAGGVNCHGPQIRGLDSQSRGSFIVSAGQEVQIEHANMNVGGAADGNDYYVAHVTGNPGEGLIQVSDVSAVVGAAANAHTHGITSDVGLSVFNVMNFRTINFNDSFSVNQNSPLVASLTNATFSNTFGANSISVSGTGFLVYGKNIIDKPPIATVSACGTSPSIAGITSGAIFVGSGTVTSCSMTLPFLQWGGTSCLFLPSYNTTLFAGPSGSPPTWLIRSSSNMAGTQIAYTCNAGR